MKLISQNSDSGKNKVFCYIVTFKCNYHVLAIEAIDYLDLTSGVRNIFYEQLLLFEFLASNKRFFLTRTYLDINSFLFGNSDTVSLMLYQPIDISGTLCILRKIVNAELCPSFFTLSMLNHEFHKSK